MGVKCRARRAAAQVRGTGTLKFSSLVNRVSGEGADAWLTHYEASLRASAART